jgi:hypothetical protein
MTDVAKLRQALRVPDAPLVNTGLASAIQFFEVVLNVQPLDWLDYLKGIDFHSSVSMTTLLRHKKVVRYDPLSGKRLTPFGYFTDAGVSPFHLGLSPSQWVFKEYTVVEPTRALVSTASAIKFGVNDSVARIGGGVQYIISRADWPKLLRVGDPRAAS